MNKPQIQTKNGNELITKENTNNKIRKSKFNKFFSTVTAVMIASSIAMGPMTLRAEDTEYDKKTKKVVKLMEEEIEKNNKKIEENNKKIEENNKEIKNNQKKLEDAKRQEMEAKKQEMEARNKLCNGLEEQIPQMQNYCSKNTCTEEQNNILKRSLNTYKEKCETLVVKSE